MELKTAETIFAACKRALEAISEAKDAATQIQDSAEKDAILGALSEASFNLLARVEAAVAIQHPAIRPPEPRGDPDTDLDDEELNAVSRLNEDDIGLIDQALMAECIHRWYKVARVAGGALNALSSRYDNLPYGYLVSRVIALVEDGKLEAQGNLHFSRTSEVRLSSGDQ